MRKNKAPSILRAGARQVAKANVSSAAFAQYIERLQSEVTAKKYKSAVDEFNRTLSRAGIESFAKMPRGTLNKYIELLAEQGYAPASIGVYVSGVKRYLRWVEDQGTKVNPQSKAEVPKKRHVMRDILTPDMLRAYVGYADDLLQEPVRTAAILLPCTGLRANELVSLPLTAIRKVDVQLQGRTRRVLSLRVTGKGGKERTVPIIGEGAQVLLTYLSSYRQTRKGPYVFPGARSRHNKKGEIPMATRTLRYAVAQLREPFGMTFTPHTMRRTYLVSLWRRGVDAPTIAKIAGHTNIQTLFQHYLNLDDQDVLRAVHESEGTRNAKAKR